MAAAAAALGIKLGAEAGSILGSILGKQHQAAVAAEANNLNAAVPQYRANLVAVVGAFNSGQIDTSTALEGIDESVAEYYSAVSGIIKDSSNHGTACTPQDASGQGSNCNGPCTVGCAWVIPWSNRIKAAIQQGSGNLSFNAIPSHAGFSGLPAWTITVSRPAASVVSLTSNQSLIAPTPIVAAPISIPAPTPLVSGRSGTVQPSSTIAALIPTTPIVAPLPSSTPVLGSLIPVSGTTNLQRSPLTITPLMFLLGAAAIFVGAFAVSKK